MKKPPKYFEEDYDNDNDNDIDNSIPQVCLICDDIGLIGGCPECGKYLENLNFGLDDEENIQEDIT